MSPDHGWDGYEAGGREVVRRGSEPPIRWLVTRSPNAEKHPVLAKIRCHAESITTPRPPRARRRFGPDAEGLETRNLLSFMMYQYVPLHRAAAIGSARGDSGTAGSSSLGPASGYTP